MYAEKTQGSDEFTLHAKGTMKTKTPPPVDIQDFLKLIVQRMDSFGQRMDELTQRMDNFEKKVNQCFNSLENEIHDVKQQVNHLEEKVDNLEVKVNRLEKKVDNVIKLNNLKTSVNDNQLG